MKIDLLYVDPPWQVEQVGRHIITNQQMTTAEIAALPVSAVMAADSVVFLWVTTPRLPDGLFVLETWGFTYRSAYFWVRQGRLGMGRWFRNHVDTLLVGTRGKVAPFAYPDRNFLIARGPRQWRKKSTLVRAMIHRIYPTAVKAELFYIPAASPLKYWIPLTGPEDLERLRREAL